MGRPKRAVLANRAKLEAYRAAIAGPSAVRRSARATLAPKRSGVSKRKAPKPAVMPPRQIPDSLAKNLQCLPRQLARPKANRYMLRFAVHLSFSAEHLDRALAHLGKSPCVMVDQSNAKKFLEWMPPNGFNAKEQQARAREWKTGPEKWLREMISCARHAPPSEHRPLSLPSTLVGYGGDGRRTVRDLHAMPLLEMWAVFFKECALIWDPHAAGFGVQAAVPFALGSIVLRGLTEIDLPDPHCPVLLGGVRMALIGPIALINAACAVCRNVEFVATPRVGSEGPQSWSARARRDIKVGDDIRACYKVGKSSRWTCTCGTLIKNLPQR